MISPHMIIYFLGWSPSLVVMGGDSLSKGREFESRHRILNGHFSHLLVRKIVMRVWKDENKWKRGRGWPFKKNYDYRVVNYDRRWLLYKIDHQAQSFSRTYALLLLVPPSKAAEEGPDVDSSVAVAGLKIRGRFRKIFVHDSGNGSWVWLS